MNRAAGLLLVALVLLLGITLTQAQPAQAAVCPTDGGQPSTVCDSVSNCFHGCCLTSGLCPSSSCMDSLDTATDDGTQCSNKCLAEVACRPFNPNCVPHNKNQACIGTTVCLTVSCDGRSAGDVCIYTGGSPNFRVCEGVE